MFVRACVPCGPKCLRWKLLMESGPVAGQLLMTCLVFCGEKRVRVRLCKAQANGRDVRLRCVCGDAVAGTYCCL